MSNAWPIATDSGVVRRVISPGAPQVSPATPQLSLAETDQDILIVVSKLKKYIRDRSGMNTSEAVAELLSDHVRAICDEAIRTAAGDGRKTVLDRDVPRLRR
jgi:histone H3/H4